MSLLSDNENKVKKKEKIKKKIVRCQQPDNLKPEPPFPEKKKPFRAANINIELNELNSLNLSQDQQEELKNIIDSYNTLHRLEFNNESILMQKGICQQYLQNYKSAIKCYVNALRMNPNNIEARVLLESCKIMGVLSVKRSELINNKDLLTFFERTKHEPRALKQMKNSGNKKDNRGFFHKSSYSSIMNALRAPFSSNLRKNIDAVSITSKENIEDDRIKLGLKQKSNVKILRKDLDNFTDEDDKNYTNHGKLPDFKKTIQKRKRSNNILLELKAKLEGHKDHLDKTKITISNKIKTQTKSFKDNLDSFKFKDQKIEDIKKGENNVDDLKIKVFDSIERLLKIIDLTRDRINTMSEKGEIISSTSESDMKWLKLNQHYFEELVRNWKMNDESDAKNLKILKKLLSLFNSANKLLLTSEKLEKNIESKSYKTKTDKKDYTNSLKYSQVSLAGRDSFEKIIDTKLITNNKLELIDFKKKPYKDLGNEGYQSGMREIEERNKNLRPKKIRTCNLSLDKLLKGGFLQGSNILVEGPPFIDKEIILYKYAMLGIRMNIPTIIINPETAPDTIREKFKLLLGDIKEFEDKNLIIWLDPESEEIKREFKSNTNSKFPEMHQLILDGFEFFRSKILAKHEMYNLVFFNLTPLIIFQEPKIINSFLSQLSKKIEQDNAIALYTIDNTVHERRDLNFVKRVMNGILEIKQKPTAENHKNPINYIKIDKFPNVRSYDWHEYKILEKNFEIKEIPDFKKVM